MQYFLTCTDPISLTHTRELALALALATSWLRLTSVKEHNSIMTHRLERPIRWKREGFTPIQPKGETLSDTRSQRFFTLFYTTSAAQEVVQKTEKLKLREGNISKQMFRNVSSEFVRIQMRGSCFNVEEILLNIWKQQTELKLLEFSLLLPDV